MYVCDFEQLLSLFVLNFSSVNGFDYQFWDVWLFWELKIHSFVSPEDFKIYLLIWPSYLAPTDSVLPLSFCCVSLFGTETKFMFTVTVAYLYFYFSIYILPTNVTSRIISFYKDPEVLNLLITFVCQRPWSVLSQDRVFSTYSLAVLY